MQYCLRHDGNCLPLLWGGVCGLGAYTAFASRAWSYLSDDPSGCVNCHIMAPYYATWNHSSHSRNATRRRVLLQPLICLPNNVFSLQLLRLKRMQY